MVNQGGGREEKNAKKDEGESRGKGRETKPSSPSAVLKSDVPAASKGERSSYEEKNYRLARKQFVVGIVTLIVLFSYTSATTYEACEMRTATEAAKTSADAATSAAATARSTLDYTKESGAQTIAQLQDQTSAMQEASRAAIAQSKTAERSLDQMAGVLSCKGFGGFGGPPRYWYVDCENMGRSIVQDITFQARVITRSPSGTVIDERTYDRKPEGEVVTPSNFSLGGSTSDFITWSIPNTTVMPVTDMPLINRGDELVMIEGTVAYDNGVGETRTQPFCSVFANSKLWGATAPKTDWFPCAEGLGRIK